MTASSETVFSVQENSDFLFQWFMTLPIKISVESVHALRSCDAFVKALEILDERAFSETGLSSMNIDYLEELKKQLVDYIRRQNQLNENPSTIFPNSLITLIDEDVEQGGVVAIGRILQLLLVCAVLCPEKEVYINEMRKLDSNITVAISKAILEVMPVSGDAESDSDVGVMSSKQLRSLSGQDWCEKCSIMQAELTQLIDERKELHQTCARLKTELEFSIDLDNERSPASKKVVSLQGEISQLREDITKLETNRDEYRLKTEDLQEQLRNSVIENEQLRRRGAELKGLQDEVDEWKTRSALLAKYETEVKVYRRKSDEAVELKQRLKTLENRNTELMKRNIELEQENAQIVSLTSSINSQERQIEDQQNEIMLARMRVENAELEIRDLQTQISSMNQKRQYVGNTQEDSQSGDLENDQAIALESSLSYELLPPSVKEDMLRLELENSSLRTEIASFKERKIETDNFLSSTQQPVDPSGSSNELFSLRNAKDNSTSVQTVDLTENENPVKETLSSSDPILEQRDVQIRHLEEEIEFLRNQYTKQQQLMTTAWYRLGFKTEQQATNFRLFGAPDGDQYSSAYRPKSFLEEQRLAVNAPVCSAQTGVAANQKSRSSSISMFRS